MDNFRVSRNGAIRFLYNLRVPVLHSPAGAFFDSVTLEATLRLLLGPGGTSLKLPGTDPANRVKGIRYLSDAAVNSIRGPESPVWTLMALIGLTHGHLERRVLDDRLTVLAGKMFGTRKPIPTGTEQPLELAVGGAQDA